MKRTIFDTAVTLIGGAAGFLWGTADGLILALLSVIALDYVTGVLIAIANKTLSSGIGFKGIVKKVFMLALVALGNIIDVHVMGNGAMFRTAVIFLLLSNEGISIIENAALLGVPVPDKLVAILKQIKDKNKEGDKTDD